MQLAPQQLQAYDEIMHWYDSGKKTYVLAGYAGTGKTTLAKQVARGLGGDVVFCAYTGKAANVLRSKGCEPSSTIHSLIYKPSQCPQTGKTTFVRIPREEVVQRVLIVDEYSMLGQDIIDDLESLYKKIIYIGDPFQLPPIKGKQEIEPDFFLTEVHRQALENPVLVNATKVRNGEDIEFTNYTNGDGEYFARLHQHEMSEEHWSESEQIITGRNITKKNWNAKMLEHLEFTDSILCEPKGGERIMCLQNNIKKGLFNGLIGKCVKTYRDQGYDRILFNGENHQLYDTVYTKEPFRTGVKPKIYNPKMDCFDYAYAMTCHKAQGSEFESVLIFNEAFGDLTEKRRWLYTAITRATKGAIVIG